MDYLGLPENLASASPLPTLYWQLLVSFRFHPAVKVINNLLYLRNCQCTVKLQLWSDSSKIHATTSNGSHLHCPQIVNRAHFMALLYLFIGWTESKLWTIKHRRGKCFRKQTNKIVFWNEWEVLQMTEHPIGLIWTPNNDFR